MKKIFVLGMLISVAMICSCQKQDSAAEQQLAKREIELDTRENAVAERESALDAREKALAARERDMATSRVKPTDVQPQGAIRDAAEAKGERDREIQQLLPEMQALILNSSQMNPAAERDRLTRERQSQGQRQGEELQSSTSGLAAPSSIPATSPPSTAITSP